MRTPRRRVRIARYRKHKRKLHQRHRQSIFECDREQQNMAKNRLPKVVILTGAGISAESGIQTFRASDGLWENHKVEDVATPEGFRRAPRQVQEFYNQRRQQLHAPEIAPNNAHLALARLEAVLGDNLLLVTQNIDNLHERAGSQRIIHMHGELLKVRCQESGQVVTRTGDIGADERCTCCQFPSPLRPHIVWFGEMPLDMERIYQAIAEANIFIAIGTSGHVYPAAGFVHEATLQGAHTGELNLEPSQVNNEFAECHYGPATRLVPEYINELLSHLHQ